MPPTETRTQVPNTSPVTGLVVAAQDSVPTHDSAHQGSAIPIT